jgi:hypothetical protein
VNHIVSCKRDRDTDKCFNDCFDRAGRYEVDGYVYNSDEEPKLLITGKWNSSMSYQPCDMEGEPLPGTELKQVSSLLLEMCCLKFLSSVFLNVGTLF